MLHNHWPYLIKKPHYYPVLKVAIVVATLFYPNYGLVTVILYNVAIYCI